jgi:predicted Zn-dependent protease with MMP-like domain
VTSRHRRCATLAGVSGRGRRDRRGRGLRGRLVPPAVLVSGRQVVVPLSRTRSERFDDLVRDAISDLEQRWATELEGVEFAVEDVPPPGSGWDEGVVADETAGGPVPLGRLLPSVHDAPPRVVVYRRPLEARASDRGDLGELVHEVVVDQVAQLLGLDPDVIDPPTG